MKGKPKTIGASEGAYGMVMGMKQSMERANGQTVSMGAALDELLAVRLMAKLGAGKKEDG